MGTKPGAGTDVMGPVRLLKGSARGLPVAPGTIMGEGDGVDPLDGNKPARPLRPAAGAGAGAGADTTGWPPNTKPDVAGAGAGAPPPMDRPPNMSRPDAATAGAGAGTGAGAGDGVVARPEKRSTPGDAEGVVPLEAGTDRPLNMDALSDGAAGAPPPKPSKSEPPPLPPLLLGAAPPEPSKSTPSAASVWKGRAKKVKKP